MSIFFYFYPPNYTDMDYSKQVPIEPESYQLFFKFMEHYAPTGFQGIGSEDELVIELEQMMERNNQFFFCW